jgi:hypothetical protein
MLAPPNRSPLLARRLAGNPVFRALTGDAGRSLASDEFYARLPVPRAPVLVVAGTGAPRARWMPHGGEPWDGVVSVGETRLEGARHHEVASIHTLIMNSSEVPELTERFLRGP